MCGAVRTVCCPTSLSFAKDSDDDSSLDSYGDDKDVDDDGADCKGGGFDKYGSSDATRGDNCWRTVEGVPKKVISHHDLHIDRYRDTDGDSDGDSDSDEFESYPRRPFTFPNRTRVGDGDQDVGGSDSDDTVGFEDDIGVCGVSYGDKGDSSMSPKWDWVTGKIIPNVEVEEKICTEEGNILSPLDHLKDEKRPDHSLVDDATQSETSSVPYPIISIHVPVIKPVPLPVGVLKSILTYRSKSLKYKENAISALQRAYEIYTAKLGASHCLAMRVLGRLKFYCELGDSDVDMSTSTR